jgi:hypothetical protein
VSAGLLAVPVWTWVFSNRTAREPAQVAFPSAAMQISYVGRLQSRGGQPDHRAALGWLELDRDNRGSRGIRIPFPSQPHVKTMRRFFFSSCPVRRQGDHLAYGYFPSAVGRDQYSLGDFRR